MLMVPISCQPLPRCDRYRLMDQQDVLVPFAITLLHTKYIYIYIIYIGVNGTLVF